jgi:hypothetical protein
VKLSLLVISVGGSLIGELGGFGGNGGGDPVQIVPLSLDAHPPPIPGFGPGTHTCLPAASFMQ